MLVDVPGATWLHRGRRPASMPGLDVSRSRMLVLTRKINQTVLIGDDVEVTVLSVTGDKVRIGIQAPREVPVYREEVYLEIQRERAAAVDVDPLAVRAEVDAELTRLSAQ